MKPKEQDQPGESRAERLRILASVFFKISSLALGGGLTMIPPIEAEFTEKRQWMTKDELVDCVAAVQSMPGIIGANLAIAVGYRTAGIPGALAAVFGMALSPFLVILLIAMCFLSLSRYEWIESAFSGVRAATCALILLTAVKMGKDMLKSPFPVCVAAAAFCFLLFLPQVNAAWVILGGAAAGILRFSARKLREERRRK